MVAGLMDAAGGRLRIPADLDQVGALRAMVRSAATAAGASSDAVDDLVQCVDEAAVNAIVHGYAGRPGWVDVHVVVVGADIVMTVEDEAPSFDPTAVAEPDMAVPALVRGPGGMGVHLIRLATDRLDYRPRAGGGNILIMTRSMAPRPKEDG